MGGFIRRVWGEVRDEDFRKIIQRARTDNFCVDCTKKDYFSRPWVDLSALSAEIFLSYAEGRYEVMKDQPTAPQNLQSYTRRVWGDITEENFYKLLDRARKEDVFVDHNRKDGNGMEWVDIGKLAAMLLMAYADGTYIILKKAPRQVESKSGSSSNKNQGADYLEGKEATEPESAPKKSSKKRAPASENPN